MGELILCKQSIAATPFFLEDAALNVYSLEELSYYISKNVYLLNSNFISVELCNWIGRELEQKELQTQLLDAIQSKAPLHIFVGLILTYNGYLTNREIKQVIQTVASFENKSPEECQKMRADRLIDNNKIVDAIYEYEYMLDEDGTKKLPREFQGDVWHNLGVAYARLFFFDEASRCFEQAYMRNHKMVSMRLMLASLRCNKNEEKFQALIDKYFIPRDVVENIKEEVSALSRQNSIREFDMQLDEDLASAQGTEIFDTRAKETLDQWKLEYNHLCKI